MLLIVYHIILAEFGDINVELHALKLDVGFQQWLARLPLAS